MTSKKEVNEEMNEIVDLSNRASRSMIAVIDTMVQRGAVRGEELSTIGQLRDQCVQIAQMCENQHSQTEES